jgi:hypothetical protein
MVCLQKYDTVSGLNAADFSNAIQNLLPRYFHICSTAMTTLDFEEVVKQMS